MNSKKKFLSAFLIITFLIYVLPAAIAGSGGNVTNENLSDENSSDENLSDENSSDENYPMKIYPMKIYPDENLSNENLSNENLSNENATDENATDDATDDANDDLIANFTADITCGYSPLNVNFNDTSQGEPTSWYWDFGDGTNSTVQNPVHTYCHSGKYDVTLTVTNEMGTDTITKCDYISVGGPRNALETDESSKTDCNENKTVCKDTIPVSKPVCKETIPVSKPVCERRLSQSAKRH